MNDIQEQAFNLLEEPFFSRTSTNIRVVQVGYDKYNTGTAALAVFLWLCHRASPIYPVPIRTDAKRRHLSP
jgi:hypothetical protein